MRWFPLPGKKKQLQITGSSQPAEVAAYRAKLIAEKFAAATSGESFRTSIFRKYEEGSGVADYEYFIAMAKDDAGKAWTVAHHVGTEKMDEIEGKIIPTLTIEVVANDLPFFAAVELLAQKEVQRLGYGKAPLDIETLPIRPQAIHFRPFAEREGICFNSARLPEPTLNGRVVIPGSYPGSVLEQANRRDAMIEERNRNWSEAVSAILNKRAGGSGYFEVVTNSAHENALYKKAAEYFQWWVTHFSDAYANIGKEKGAFTAHVPKKGDDSSDFLVNYYLQEAEKLRLKEIGLWVKASLPTMQNKVLRRQIEEAYSIISIMENLGQSHARTLDDPDLSKYDSTYKVLAREIEEHARLLKYSKEEIELLKAYQIGSAPLSLPFRIVQFANGLEKFSQQYGRMIENLRAEMDNPLITLDRDALKEKYNRMAAAIFTGDAVLDSGVEVWSMPKAALPPPAVK